MKAILTGILLSLFTLTAQAQPLLPALENSGLFINPARGGESLQVFQSGGYIQFSFFGYIKRCNLESFSNEAFIDSPSFNFCRPQPIWFQSTAHPMIGGQAVGNLLMAVANDDFPFVDLNFALASPRSIGLFILVKTPTGYQLDVLRTGVAISPFSHIYSTTHNFPTKIWGPQ